MLAAAPHQERAAAPSRLAAWGLLALVACQKTTPVVPDPFWAVPATFLSVPQVEGWIPDGSLDPIDPEAAGGVVMRLVPSTYVVGSPRLEVVLEAPPSSPTLLQSFLTRSLQDMARLERGGQVHIHHVEQRRTHVGRHDAYRVGHEYTVGQGAQTVAIRQIATFLVLDGRGVAVTAAGRVELFHPLAEGIARMLDGLRIAGEEAAAPATVVPEDLGTLGGSRQL